MRRSNKRSYSKYRTTRSRSRSNYYKPTTKKRKVSVGRTLGSIVGSMTPLGGKVGGYLGEAIGSGIKSVFGKGDYYIPSHPVIKNSLKINPGDTPPQFQADKRSTRVCHREYVTDIYSSQGFEANTFVLNPGIGKTFPWLSTVAANYEVYKIHGMLFEFKSMSSNALNSTNTALGSVIMATQYNASSPDFLNKQQMENYEFAQSCKPAESMFHYIECEPKYAPLSELYIRTGDLDSGQIQQVYDYAKFTIATQGMQQGAVNIGELWVTYDIELLKPKLISGQIGDNVIMNLVAGVGNVKEGNWLGTNKIHSLGNTLEVVEIQNTLATTTYELKGTVTGKYMIMLYLKNFSNSGFSSPTIEPISNCVELKIFPGGGSTTYPFVTGWNRGWGVANITGTASDNVCLIVCCIEVIGADPTFSILNGAMTTSATAPVSSLLVVQLNGKTKQPGTINGFPVGN